MSAADVFKGLLALGAGGLTGYVQQKRINQQNDVRQQMKDMELAVRSENIRRMAAEDESEAARREAQSANDRAKTAISGELKDFKLGDEFNMRLKNIESQVGYRDALANQGYQRLADQMSRFEQGLEETKKWHSAQIDDATGKKVTGGGAGAAKRPSMALSAFKSQLTSSRAGVSGDMLMALDRAQADDEYFQFLQQQVSSSGIRLGKRLNKKEAIALDEVFRRANAAYDAANAPEQPVEAEQRFTE